MEQEEVGEEGGEEEGEEEEEEEEGNKNKKGKLLSLSHLTLPRLLLPVSEELKKYIFEANTAWPVLPEEIQPKVYQGLFSFIPKVCLWILPPPRPPRLFLESELSY